MAKLYKVMTLSEFDGCCTTYVLSGFPFDRSYLGGNRTDKADYEQHRKELHDLITAKSNFLNGKTWIVATLTDGQETSIKLLDELGFTKTEGIKGTYPELVSLFYISAAELKANHAKLSK